MNHDDQFAMALSYLQCVLLARRQQIDLGSLRLKWIDFDILNALLAHKKLQPSSLSQLLSVSRPAMSKRLSYLQKNELVILERQQADKRAYTVALTAAGRGVMEMVFRSHRNTALAAKQALSAEEQTQFAALAQKLASQLDDVSLRMI